VAGTSEGESNSAGSQANSLIQKIFPISPLNSKILIVCNSMIPIGSGGEGGTPKIANLCQLLANQGIVMISEKLCSGIREKAEGNIREKRHKKD